MREAWRLDRVTEQGVPWTLVGLDFPDATSSQLTLSTHPERRTIDVEIRVGDVKAAYRALAEDPQVSWLASHSASRTGTSPSCRRRTAMSSC